MVQLLVIHVVGFPINYSPYIESRLGSFFNIITGS